MASAPAHGALAALSERGSDARYVGWYVLTTGRVRESLQEAERVYRLDALRFGFRNVPGLVHEGVPPEVFLVLPFTDAVPQGRAVFHDGFRANS